MLFSRACPCPALTRLPATVLGGWGISNRTTRIPPDSLSLLVFCFFRSRTNASVFVSDHAVVWLSLPDVFQSGCAVQALSFYPFLPTPFLLSVFKYTHSRPLFCVRFAAFLLTTPQEKRQASERLHEHTNIYTHGVQSALSSSYVKGQWQRQRRTSPSTRLQYSG